VAPTLPPAPAPELPPAEAVPATEVAQVPEGHVRISLEQVTEADDSIGYLYRVVGRKSFSGVQSADQIQLIASKPGEPGVTAFQVRVCFTTKPGYAPSESVAVRSLAIDSGDSESASFELSASTLSPLPIGATKNGLKGIATPLIRGEKIVPEGDVINLVRVTYDRSAKIGEDREIGFRLTPEKAD
jgi:hypothetical protein